MIGKLAEYWWGRVPRRMSRVSAGLGVVFGDGGYLEAIPPVAALAPVLALFFGFIIGWRHPLATDLFTSSVAFMVLALVVGTLSAAVGAWLVIGYAVGDIVIGVRDPAFLGAFTNAGKTWAALLLCAFVLAMLVVLIPLTARALANEASARWLAGRPFAAEAGVAALAEALLVFAWTQAALVLTRPYFTWHGLAPSTSTVEGLHTAAWALPLVAIGAAALRAWLDVRYAAATRKRLPVPAQQRRRAPQPVAIAVRALIAVFLLAGLMDSWVDPIIVGAVMIAFLALREPLLRRLGPRTAIVMRVPILPRLIVGSVISAIIAIIVVAAFGTQSVVRPVVISTLVSLIVFTVLLPDHILEHAREPAGEEPMPALPPPPPSTGAVPAAP
jgi:hypothetical protein